MRKGARSSRRSHIAGGLCDVGDRHQHPFTSSRGVSARLSETGPNHPAQDLEGRKS
jgi:hypothetical protein